MLQSILMILADMRNQSRKPMDKGILMLIVLMTCFGMIMIWSASMYNAKLAGNEFYYVAKQFKFAAAGFFLMLLMSLCNYNYLRKISDGALFVTLLLLIGVHFLGEGSSVNGAVRGIEVFGFTIMPAEFAKVSILMFMAKEIDKRTEELSSFKNFVLLAVFLAVFAVLIYLQPALSTAIIVSGLIIGMYFMAGGNLFYIVTMGSAVLAAVIVFIRSNEWRMQRILAYQDPWQDILVSGWQPAHSLMALGAGGFFGQGIGNGSAKMKFLPEPQNDYIFAIIGEEAGLLGCTLLIAVYFILIFKIVKVSLAAPDTFGRMLCSGMALLLGIQVVLNIAVVTNVLPPTGVMLPFISAGGSSLITLMLAAGIVLNVSRNAQYTK